MIIDLTRFNCIRPEKIQWVFELTTPEIIDSVRSKNLRAFLRNTPRLLDEHNITFDLEPLTAQGFMNWLPYYKAKMAERGYEIMANENWFKDRKDKGWQLFGLWFRRGDQLIGSAIVSLHAGVGTIHFKASERIELSGRSNSSFGAVIDYVFAEQIRKKSANIISGGRSPNAFGVFDSLGLLNFKLSFGYVLSNDPLVFEPSGISSEVPVNSEGIVAFWGQSTDGDRPWALYALTPNEWNDELEIAHFAGPRLPFVHVRY